MLLIFKLFFSLDSTLLIISICNLFKTEENSHFIQYRSSIEKDLPLLYGFSIFTCLIHFIVGVVWQNIDITGINSTKLGLPYFGGYIILVSLALALVFVYNILVLKKEPNVPKFMRRFYMTLSVIALVGSIVLVIVLTIRANDYRQSEDSLSKHNFGIAETLTIMDIILTIIALPIYFYFVLINYHTLQLTPEDKETTQNQQHVFVMEGNNNHHDHQHQFRPPSSDNEIHQNHAQGIRIQEILPNLQNDINQNKQRERIQTQSQKNLQGQPQALTQR